LVLDFRMDIVKQRMKDIQQRLRQVGNDMEKIMQLMKEQKETQELRDALAKKIGSDLIAN